MKYRKLLSLPMRFDERCALAMMRVMAQAPGGEMRVIAEYALPQGQHAKAGELVAVEFFDRRAKPR
jgi:hypothetical protein